MNSCESCVSGGTWSSWNVAAVGMKMAVSLVRNQGSWLCFALQSPTQELIYRRIGNLHWQRNCTVFTTLLTLLHWTSAACRFLYALFLALDGNFQLKWKKVSSNEQDPSLSDGLSFFVKNEPYKEHLEKHWDQKQEVCGCFLQYFGTTQPMLLSSAAPVWTMMLSTNLIERRAALLPLALWLSTVPAIISNGQMRLKIFNWARSKTISFLFFWLLTFSRYLHTDYVLDKSLVATALICLVISYNIACQWHKKLRKGWRSSLLTKLCRTTSNTFAFWFPSSIFQRMWKHVTWDSHSTLWRALAGLMARHLSEVGLISTRQCRVPRRWGQGRDAIPWMTTSAIGTGRK